MSVKNDIRQIFKHLNLLSEQYKQLECRLSDSNGEVECHQSELGLIYCEATFEQWRSVVEGEYLCGFSTVSYDDAELNSIYAPMLLCGVRESIGDCLVFNVHSGSVYDFCAIRRVYWDKQPWFGEGSPLIDQSEYRCIVAKIRCGKIITSRLIEDFCWGWSATSKCELDVMEFTLFK